MIWVVLGLAALYILCGVSFAALAARFGPEEFADPIGATGAVLLWPALIVFGCVFALFGALGKLAVWLGDRP